MNSFISWIGGKKALRDVILDRFPIYYERYIEVFGGAGWVLFKKPPGNDFEVYNDYNSNLANLYRCVREHSAELIEKLIFVLNSREDFHILKNALQEKTDMSDVERAALFYQLIRYSYASDCESFASQPYDIWSGFPIIGMAHSRLRKTVIENKDFEKLIGQYDRPVSFFYCDPPYFETEDYYTGFTRNDHKRLHDCLLRIEGKFLLSYNDCDFIRALYKEEGLRVFSVSRINNIKQRFESGAMYPELLIANYDMDERRLLLPKQINLFEYDTEN